MEGKVGDYALIKDRNCCQRTFSPMTPGCMRASIFSHCSTTIGAGVLSLPFACAQCGAVLGSILIAVAGIAYYFSYMLLVYSCNKFDQYDFVVICSKQFGQFFRRLTEVVLILMCFGAITSYMVLIPQFIGSILTMFQIIDDSQIWITKVILIIGFNVLVWFPMTIPKQLTALRYASLLSVIGISYVTLVVILSTPYYVSQNTDFSSEVSLLNIDQSFIDTMGIIYYNYNSAQNVPTIFKELQNRDLRRMNKVLFRAFAILIGISLCMGLLGYLSYTDLTPKLIVNRPAPGGGAASSDWIMLIGKIMVCLYLTVAVPINNNPLRKSVENLFYGEEPDDNIVRRMIICAIILASGCAISIAMPDILVYFNILGGLFCTYLSFLLPTVFFCKASDNLGYKVGVCIFCFVICGVGLTVSVSTIAKLV